MRNEEGGRTDRCVPMPSLLHEGIVALVREKPELAADLLRELQHVSVPAFTEARLAEAIPVITDFEVALRDPHLAVLSVMAHGGDDDVQVAVAAATVAVAGVASLPEPLRMLCFALIESSLGDAARKSFEMLPQAQKFFSETQRRSFAQGHAEGQAEGQAQGQAEGQAQGEAKGKAESILRVLEPRRIAISLDQRERVLACTDLATLERWLDAAVTSASTEELFG